MLRYIIIVFTILAGFTIYSQQVLGPFAGAVTESSVTFIIASPPAAMVKIEYSENANFTGSAATAEQLPGDGSGYTKHPASELKPDTRYYYRAVIETIDE